MVLKHKVEGSLDSRNRPTVTYIEDEIPLKVLAIGPASADDTDTQVEEKYVDQRMMYLPKKTVISTTDRVTWLGFDWDVLKVDDYNFGPWSLGGVTALIGRSGESNG